MFAGGINRSDVQTQYILAGRLATGSGSRKRRDVNSLLHTLSLVGCAYFQTPGRGLFEGFSLSFSLSRVKSIGSNLNSTFADVDYGRCRVPCG